MSEEIQNEEEIVVEDVQEEDLVENQELEQDTPEEVAEESQESLSDSVLDVLLGEAKKKNEAEDEEDEEESDDEESDDEEEDEDEEMEESVEVDEETIEESSEETEEEVIEESSEETEEEVIEESSEEEVEEEALEEGVQTKAGILADAFSTIKSLKKHDLVKAFEAMNGDDEEEDEMEEGKSPKPSTKAEMINAMYKEMKGMKKDDLMAAYGAIKSAMAGEEDEEEMEEAFATDLKVLADADSNLTEDFKAKASTLFEAAVANKVATIKEELENTYEDSLQEEIVYIRESLIEKIDNYLTYVVEDWMSENQEYVDNKLRTDIAEDFMKNLKNLFVESYIEVPESKVDLVDSLSEDVETTKSELLTVSEERDSLASQVEELQREKIISEATSDLTSTQSSKFVKLLEGIEFVDASNFETKVSVIKESFFNEEEPTQELEEEVSSDETEIIVEGEGDPNAELSPTMQKYLSSLSRIQQNSHK